MDDFRISKSEEGLPSSPVSDDVSERSSENLVKLAIDGDTSAFGNLYLIYVEKIYRYIYYSVQSKTVTEDLTQEVFLKAWGSIKSCKGKEATFSSWLYRIAHNLMVDRIRKFKRRAVLEIQSLDSEIDTKATFQTTLEQQDLLRVLDRLPENQKRVIIMKFIDDLNNREIAEILGKSEGAVRIQQMRALSALKQMLEKE